MQNPILSKWLGIIAFVLWWTVAILAQFVTFYSFYELPLGIAISDSFIFNLTFALLSIGIWYWVRYSDLEKQRALSVVLNHIAAAVLSILVWVTISSLILKTIFPDEPEYLDFLKTSLPWRFAIGTFYYILSGLIYYLIIYVQNFREQINREAEVKTLVRDAELNWLKHQINPHFLFNSLNSISSLTMTDPEKAQEMVIRLSDLLRYSLKQSSQSLVTISDEISNCIKYLDIEKVRFGKRLNYKINAPENVMSFQVPAMILQPLFENAIKHGIAATSEPGEVVATFEKNQNILKICIQNTISSESKPAKGTGVGLANIARRLSLLYGMNDLIQTKSHTNLYTVEVLIPTLNR
ncbi:MAG TPA: histidine kinase [Bacteroidales bacterium]|nr:histidine kinase [Bacteroidales bacterium]